MTDEQKPEAGYPTFDAKHASWCSIRNFGGKCNCRPLGAHHATTSDTGIADGDPSAMGEPEKLPPLRKFAVWMYYPIDIEARSVQDAMDMARARWGDWVCDRVEAK